MSSTAVLAGSLLTRCMTQRLIVSGSRSRSRHGVLGSIAITKCNEIITASKNIIIARGNSWPSRISTRGSLHTSPWPNFNDFYDRFWMQRVNPKEKRNHLLSRTIIDNWTQSALSQSAQLKSDSLNISDRHVSNPNSFSVLLRYSVWAEAKVAPTAPIRLYGATLSTSSPCRL